MSNQLTRSQFLQAGLGLGVLIAGCGDSGTGGAGGGPSGGSPATGGSPNEGGSPPNGGSPTEGGSPPTGGSPEGGAPPAACTAALVALISGNHPNGAHALTIQPADLDSPTDITYDISGAAKHCHEIILTVADFATLKGGGSVTKFTCNGGDHEISLSCGTAPAPGVPVCGKNDTNGTCG